MSGEQARLWAKNSTTNLEAWEKWLQGDEYLFRFTKEDNATARRLFEEVIVLDPEYAFAYVMLGWTYYLDARFGWVDSRAESFKMAGKYAQKGMELNDTLDNAYLLMGSFYFSQGQHEKAIAEVERAIALNPNGANNYSILGAIVGALGRWDESIQLAKKSIRLRPFAPANYYHWLGCAYFMTGQYDEAIATLKKILDNNPNYLPAHAFLAACYSSLDRHAEAAAAADEVRRINPKFNLESYAKTLPYKKADIERYIAALRKVGLPDKPPLPLPDKPSIAVLPFENMSGDPEQKYFSDGFTEHIITSLSKVPYIFVIARQSSFSFRDKQMTVQQIAKELGVRYILEGSIQRSGERLRITAQLIDATSGHHIWAENYDRKLKDIFVLQDEIAMNIMAGLQVNIAQQSLGRSSSIQTKNLKAYEKFLKGWELHFRKTEEDSLHARKIFKEAIALDPEYGAPYVMLGHTHLDDIMYWRTKDRAKSLQTADQLAQKAIELTGQNDFNLRLLSVIFMLRRQYDKAIIEIQKAIELSPNSAHAYFVYGTVLRFSGRNYEAIPIFKKAIRLNPVTPIAYLNMLAWAYFYIEQYEEAIPLWNRTIELNPDYLFAYQGLIGAYQMSGDEIKARESVAEILRIRPTYSMEMVKKFTIKDIERKKRVLEAYRKAGIPE